MFVNVFKYQVFHFQPYRYIYISCEKDGRIYIDLRFTLRKRTCFGFVVASLSLPPVYIPRVLRINNVYKVQFVQEKVPLSLSPFTVFKYRVRKERKTRQR